MHSPPVYHRFTRFLRALAVAFGDGQRLEVELQDDVRFAIGVGCEVRRTANRSPRPREVSPEVEVHAIRRTDLVVEERRRLIAADHVLSHEDHHAVAGEHDRLLVPPPPVQSRNDRIRRFVLRRGADRNAGVVAADGRFQEPDHLVYTAGNIHHHVRCGGEDRTPNSSAPGDLSGTTGIARWPNFSPRGKTHRPRQNVAVEVVHLIARAVVVREEQLVVHVLTRNIEHHRVVRERITVHVRHDEAIGRRCNRNGQRRFPEGQRATTRSVARGYHGTTTRNRERIASRRHRGRDDLGPRKRGRNVQPRTVVLHVVDFVTSCHSSGGQ